MRFLIFCLFLTLPGALSAEGDPCGPDSPCKIDDGDYHMILPPDWDGQTALPALVFFHGHNSSARSVFRAGSLRRTFGEAGYVIIAPNGAVFPGRNIRGWPGRGNFDGRDDVAFTLSVLDDASQRIPIDTEQVYAAGFSAGGSMVWLLACREPERFAAYASVSGALRRPNPTDCPTAPVRFLQVHGFADAQVPFEGRAIRDWHQGDLGQSFAQARAANQCRSNPDAIKIGETFRCRSWGESCAAGELKMCIHDGGHGLPRGWTDMALEFFESR